jgi:hypothetical protein
MSCFDVRIRYSSVLLIFCCFVVLLFCCPSRGPALPASSPCSRGSRGHTSHSSTLSWRTCPYAPTPRYLGVITEVRRIEAFILFIFYCYCMLTLLVIDKSLDGCGSVSGDPNIKPAFLLSYDITCKLDKLCDASFLNPALPHSRPPLRLIWGLPTSCLSIQSPGSRGNLLFLSPTVCTFEGCDLAMQYVRSSVSFRALLLLSLQFSLRMPKEFNISLNSWELLLCFPYDLSLFFLCCRYGILYIHCWSPSWQLAVFPPP